MAPTRWLRPLDYSLAILCNQYIITHDIATTISSATTSEPVNSDGFSVTVHPDLPS